ncbi:transposase (fragment) [Mesorhizobium plurifarium]|uniref:Transposase n=1 Tax=Mesorhizobium plurifarium TaxID=69974 RepID=A0A090GGI5_MESPL
MDARLLQGNLLDLEHSGVLSGSGLKVGEVSRGKLYAPSGHRPQGTSLLETVIGAMFATRIALRCELTDFRCEMLKIAR